ncbi:hypothetical protein SLS62_010776 [Diatrype stigma]|uniref:Xylanolytic transcriptional activator regulatory domain-containing protein n=1 Tax=Diatrype stigma TaxID=117547 RepID=A0AAN9YG81_9PEZI
MVQSCEVLSFLKDKSTIYRLVSRAFELGGGSTGVCIEPIMKQWLQKLGLHYGNVLVDQEPAKIRRLCETIWHNTRSPLAFDGNISAMDWASLGTGPNIRWEVIGMIAAIAGSCAVSLEPSDPFLAEAGISGLDFARRMKGLSEICLGFCYDCNVISDMLLWLVVEWSCLVVRVEGDISYASYRASGEEVNIVITMGLHQKIEANNRLPFFLAEIRKSIFIAIYASEIGLSAFLGRPPRLSYHYCTLDPPLDLTEAQLMLGPDEIAEILKTLDKDGYNTVGRIGSAVRIRSRIELTCRREDILDLALGKHTREEVLHRAQVIQERTEQEWARLPEFIRKIRDGAASESHATSAVKPHDRLINFSFCQLLRNNELLLQRVLIRKAGASSEKLLQEARAMFKDVLHLSQRFDVASAHLRDVNSILVVHGLRSAAILAVELLKQEQLPHPDSARLPRSQTIQELAVFAARLGSVDPRDGSFAMCDQGRKVIQRILDKVLSPLAKAADKAHPDRRSLWDGGGGGAQQQQMSAGQLDASAAASGEPIRNCGLTPEITATTMDIDFGFDAPYLGHDRDFMQWLEHVDWDRPEAWNTF